MTRLLTVGCAVAVALWAITAMGEEKPTTGPSSPRKVLFLGNSITLHGPAPTIGWTSNWGMAASSPDKDYVHRVTAGLTADASAGAAPQVLVKNIVAFERGFETFDAKEQLPDALQFRADLIIVAIGENVHKLDSDTARTQFATATESLLHTLKAETPTTIVVRSCFWPNRDKDEILKKACEDVGGIFVDISDLSQDPSNYARSERAFENKGVGNHPGDKGMSAIADAILKAIKCHRSPASKS